MTEEMLRSKENKRTDAKLAVYYEGALMREQAAALASHLGAFLADSRAEAEHYELQLRLDEQGLTLTGDGQEMRGDLTHMLPRLKQSNLEREILVKAARIKGAAGPLLAIDATAGMGEDSILLAAAGYEVWLYEQDPVIAALLSDALQRAAKIPEFTAIAERMHLHEGDSILAMRHLERQPDVVVLDPMFPERQKSALVKKKFQLLHHLERPCADEEALLEAAIVAKPRKIVIKRPVKGPWLAGRKPDYTLSGKAIRYDCLTFAR